ncbi:unnamed protein product [Owenia fusiformis]|uniref:Uncharacterized protein n=1 Tax=Owenia fusiformis TaxID=6347 RepID=A0A8J1THZ6_OWEFU|nr:unnamed protein product [Owenia fusiformis]
MFYKYILRMRHFKCSIKTSVFGLFLVAIATGLVTIHTNASYLMNMVRHTDHANAISGQHFSGFLVNTPGCKIPDINPFDTSIRHLVTHDTLECDGAKSLTFTEGSLLKINRSLLETTYFNFSHCSYQAIQRDGNNETDRLFRYDPKIVKFKDEVKLRDEFIRVVCHNIPGKMIYTNFHAVVFEKHSVEKDCAETEAMYSKTAKEKALETFNLIILGVDSVSRLNFMRQMPKTRAYLTDVLQALELTGYNKVADNTYVNLVPMFAGKFVEELPWDERYSDIAFDKYEFFWNQAQKRGYRTLYAEDAPEIAIFNYEKEGFHKPPAHYYLRPFSLAMENHGSVWDDTHNCVGDKLETNKVLDYVNDFVKLFKNRLHLAFAFITRLTHENINLVGVGDDAYLEFFKTIHQQGNLENSVVLFYSDHGIRFGKIRETNVGKLEERLPFLYWIFPKWFYKKYPHLDKTLRTNAHRLTTPFDIYATLQDIIDFKGITKVYDKPVRGMSLFSEIPVTRTCEDAWVFPHWCTCQKQISVNKTDGHVIHAANMVVQFINDQTSSHRKLCTLLKLSAITDARMTTSSDEVLKFRESHNSVLGRKVDYGSPVKPIIHYQIILRTFPGDALFEATVRYSDDDGKYHIMGDISRINKYGDQSACICKHQLKKFCFCG